MGNFRLLFACCVVLWHCPVGVIDRFLHPALAVQCFYAISGFLIQMVIRAKYQGVPGWERRFYASRLLRIYPLYLLFLTLTFVLFGGNCNWDYFASRNLIPAGLVYCLNNIFIVGQDILRFFYFDANAGHFSLLPAIEEQRPAAVAVSCQMTLMGQSWTLALELYFYLLAPLLLMFRTLWLAILVSLLIVLRFWLGYQGHYQSEWIYGFFPCELAVFLLGSLACRLYFHFFASGRFANLLGERTSLAICGIVVYAACYIYVTVDLNFVSAYPRVFAYIPLGSWGAPLGTPAGYWLILLMTVFLLPFAFHFSKKLRFDQFIGELSYPVYICHFLVLSLVTKKMTEIPEKHVGLTVLIVSIGLSVVLLLCFERPLDRLRHRLFYKPSPVTAPAVG